MSNPIRKYKSTRSVSPKAKHLGGKRSRKITRRRRRN